MRKKDKARNLAMEWQYNFGNRDRSWSYCISWHWRFKKLARKYRLVREFKENGIL